jgi:hypothetical protein
LFDFIYVAADNEEMDYDNKYVNYDNETSVIVHFNYFWFFLARQPQGVLLDRVPPFKPCANAFFSLLLCFMVASSLN